MNYSTNLADLLERQHQLQQLGGHCAPEDLCTADVGVALLAELGELAQELKPDWAWWRKPGDTEEIDRQRVLEEAADVLHFILLSALVRFPLTELKERYRGMGLEVPGYFLPTERPCAPLLFIASFMQGEQHAFSASSSLCRTLMYYGFTPEDLARAYWEKSEVNLARWQAVKADQAEEAQDGAE